MITSEIEAEKNKLFEDWKAVREVNQETFKSAKDIADQSSVSDVIEITSSRAPSTQRKFAPDQSLKPKLLSDSADLLEVRTMPHKDVH